MSRSERITVVGGGFSGLTQAFYLAEAGYKVRLVEKEPQLGGLIHSHQRGQYLVETAANAMIANQELERISKKIGVPLFQTKNSAKKRFIFHRGQMSRWPLGLFESFPLAVFLVQQKMGRARPSEAESLQEWGSRLLSPQILEKLMEPAMQGVYAASSDRLNARLVYDSFNRKVKKGNLRGSVSPKKGMQEWLDGLRRFIIARGAEIAFGFRLDQFDFSKPHILAVDLAELKRLAHEEKLSLPKSLRQTQLASLSTVVLAFNDKKLSAAEGFGCLFPKKENFHSLGVLFNHNIFSHRCQNGASETWILNDEKLKFSSMSPKDLEKHVMSDRLRMNGKDDKPDSVFYSQWPQRIPLYDENLSIFLKNLKNEKTPFLLMGNYLGDLGLGKLIFRAKENVKKLSEGYFG